MHVVWPIVADVPHRLRAWLDIEVKGYSFAKCEERVQAGLSQREALPRRLSDGICAAPMSLDPAINFALAG
jgi:hypothetical protein